MKQYTIIYLSWLFHLIKKKEKKRTKRAKINPQKKTERTSVKALFCSAECSWDQILCNITFSWCKTDVEDIRVSYHMVGYIIKWEMVNSEFKKKRKIRPACDEYEDWGITKLTGISKPIWIRIHQNDKIEIASECALRKQHVALCQFPMQFRSVCKMN